MHHDLTEVFASHTFVGIVDDQRRLAAVQGGVKLYLIDYGFACFEYCYQIGLTDFGNFGSIRFSPPLELKELLRIAARQEKAEVQSPEEDFEVEDVVRRVAEQLAQYRALIEGAELAERLNTTCGPACDEAPAVGCFLNSDSYWNGRHHIANINTNTQRSGKDANTMLGANAAFDIAASCDSATIQPCHPRALASFKQWVDAWRDPAEYPINEGIPSNEGIAIGRYTEDIYYNGNPWYLITLGAGEFLFNAAHQWKAHGYITIDSTSLPFFQDLWPEAKVGTFKRPCSKNPKAPFNVIVEAANRYGDSFLSVAQKYTPADGSLAEQYNRDPPFEPQSARDLTWSYAAFVTAAARRAGEFPPTWVPAKLPIPSTCAASSARGTYTPATAAGAPDLGEVPCAALVTFRVDARTYYGEDIYVVGGAPSLGIWNVENAQPLTADAYTDARPLWAIDVDLDAAGETVTYQFVRRQNCGQGYIYETVNRTVDVPACGVTTPTVLEATWTGPVGTPGNC
ncbi:Glucoamylase P like protein [Verticillium longisporum]|nr:Glucoamylase P like protein [Verticillium longisporum]